MGRPSSARFESWDAAKKRVAGVRVGCHTVQASSAALGASAGGRRTPVRRFAADRCRNRRCRDLRQSDRGHRQVREVGFPLCSTGNSRLEGCGQHKKGRTRFQQAQLRKPRETFGKGNPKEARFSHKGALRINTHQHMWPGKTARYALRMDGRRKKKPRACHLSTQKNVTGAPDQFATA